ncbi:MAG: hypothetical protein ACRDRR_01980 [Pseudonocardiaceae bacterium]
MSAFETQEWETYEREAPGYGELEWGSETEYENQEQFLGGLLGSALGGRELESPLGELQEMELATELLEVSSEAELEQFLGKLISGAAKAVGGVIKSPVGQALGGALKSVAKAALPMAAGALGNLVLPGVGGMVGSKLGSMASKLFEFEGMDEQEAELEVAQRYVRFASAAARNAARAPRGAPPRAVVHAAVVSAARRHAPGLVRGARPGGSGQPGGRPGRPPRRPPPGRRPSPGSRSGMYGFSTNGGPVDEPDEPSGWDEDDDAPDQETGRSRSGRWFRRGRKLVIFGC